jgi:phosphatidylglycerophosphate synthase
MTALADSAPPPPPRAPGRPPEIEEWTNLRLVHPLSRRLVEALIPTGVSPNAVSMMGVVMAAVAGVAYFALPWPFAALVGFAFHLAWHVFDGADGQLARRTGRASPNGELVDGICDHLGQLCIYVAFAALLAPALGGWAFALALAAGLSRAVQANAYETLRRNYRRWVYGAGWIRQTLGATEAGADGPWKRGMVALGRAYLAVSSRISADDSGVEAAMTARTAGADAAAARALYQERMQPLVKRASALSANYRTLAALLSMLAGSPLWYLLWEIVGLNLVLAAVVAAEARANRRLAAALG